MQKSRQRNCLLFYFTSRCFLWRHPCVTCRSYRHPDVTLESGLILMYLYGIISHYSCDKFDWKQPFTKDSSSITLPNRITQKCKCATQLCYIVALQPGQKNPSHFIVPYAVKSFNTNKKLRNITSLPEGNFSSGIPYIKYSNEERFLRLLICCVCGLDRA